MSANRSRACWGLARIPTAAARRTFTGRVSPRAPRPVARPPMEALNRNASGASARMKISSVPGSVGWSLTHTPNDPCAAASASAAASGSHSIQQAAMMASIRPHDKEWAYFGRSDGPPPRRSPPTGGGWPQRSGGRSTASPHPHTILAHSRGRRWRRSSASPTSRSAADGRGRQHHTELGRCELRHPRCPVPTEQHQLLRPGQQRTGRPGELTVQVSPMGGGLQQPDLGLFGDRTGVSRRTTGWPSRRGH